MELKTLDDFSGLGKFSIIQLKGKWFEYDPKDSGSENDIIIEDSCFAIIYGLIDNDLYTIDTYDNLDECKIAQVEAINGKSVCVSRLLNDIDEPWENDDSNFAWSSEIEEADDDWDRDKKDVTMSIEAMLINDTGIPQDEYTVITPDNYQIVIDNNLTVYNTHVDGSFGAADYFFDELKKNGQNSGIIRDYGNGNLGQFFYDDTELNKNI